MKLRVLSAMRYLADTVSAWLHRHPLPFLGLAILTALYAQLLLDQDKHLNSAGILYGVAAVLFLLACGGVGLAPRIPDAPEQSGFEGDKRQAGRPFAWLLAGISIVLGILSFPRFKGNVFRADGTLLWLLGLLLLGIACWDPRARRQPESVPDPATPPSSGLRLTSSTVLLLGIMLLGGFYRLYQIDRIPLEMGCDLPHNYANIRLILRGEYPVFFPSYPGREGLLFYLSAPFCRLYGLNYTNMKIVTGLLGVLALPTFYLLGKELFNREVGLYAAFLLSVSSWAVILCRLGYRASLVPGVLALTLYFLVRALKSGRRWFYALAGFFLGLGMYTYSAYMMVPPLIAVILVALLFTRARRAVLARPRYAALLFVVALYVFIPLGRYAYDQPQTYGYRVVTRIAGDEPKVPTNIVPKLLENIRKTLLMLNYRGDNALSSNVPGARHLSLVTAVLFVLGLAYVLWRWRQGGNALLVVTLLVMLLPSAMALAFPQEVPNGLRAIGALPAALVVASAALAAARQAASTAWAESRARTVGINVTVDDVQSLSLSLRWSTWSQHAVGLLLVATLVWEAHTGYVTYFQRWVDRLPDKNYSISLELARAIDGFSGEGQAFIKPASFWYDGSAVRAQLRRTDQNWNNEIGELRPDQLPLSGPPGKFMVILHPQDSVSLRSLRERFPEGIETRHLGNDGKVAFVTFYGERQPL